MPYFQSISLLIFFTAILRGVLRGWTLQFCIAGLDLAITSFFLISFYIYIITYHNILSMALGSKMSKSG